MAKHDNLRILLTVLDRGHFLPDHQTDGRILIQAITGHMIVRIGADPIDLAAGRLLVLDRAYRTTWKRLKRVRFF